MQNSKDLDKFYTNPTIAKGFVNIIQQHFPLDQFDLIVEPSAGNGSFLSLLPENSIGLDLEPESPGIIRQDFFKYESPYHPLFNNIKIACIGNPPFGSGYMNPLAKAFFNHAATFSQLIAFIVPAKWQTSWKVHYQLNESFGLYFSEILPKDSFLLDGEPYDVPCCMQIWSKTNPNKLKNLRITKRPPTEHEDFEMFLTCDNVPRLEEVREQIRNKEYWDFAIKYWGNIRVCDFDEVPYGKRVEWYVHDIPSLSVKLNVWGDCIEYNPKTYYKYESILCKRYEKLMGHYPLLSTNVGVE